MANVTNTSDRELTLPGVGLTIPAGSTLRVDNWETVKDHPHVASWIAIGALAEEPEEKAKPKPKE